MKAYSLSHKARRDLDDIWDYSRHLWGERRGARYLNDIRAAMNMVAEHPDIGSELTGLPPYRKRPVGSHLILYRLRDNRVVIVRILHQNMEIARAMPDH